LQSVQIKPFKLIITSLTRVLSSSIHPTRTATDLLSSNQTETIKITKTRASTAIVSIRGLLRWSSVPSVTHLCVFTVANRDTSNAIVTNCVRSKIEANRTLVGMEEIIGEAVVVDEVDSRHI
jgi:hypothetical protein